MASKMKTTLSKITFPDIIVTVLDFAFLENKFPITKSTSRTFTRFRINASGDQLNF